MIAVDTPHHVTHTPPRSTASVQPSEQKPPETSRPSPISPDFPRSPGYADEMVRRGKKVVSVPQRGQRQHALADHQQADHRIPRKSGVPQYEKHGEHPGHGQHGENA
jgi:hypothetical protein